MLKRLSKFAEGIREHWRPPALALAVSYFVWLAIEAIALLRRDWERVVDVRGQRALNHKTAGQAVLALYLMRSCLQLQQRHLASNRYLHQLYLGEVAELLSAVAIKRRAKAYDRGVRIGPYQQQKLNRPIHEASKLAYKAYRLAEEVALPDLCRRLYQLGEIQA